MGFRRKLRWLILVLMPLFLFTGCGDLEPEMQDTRTVILNMDFHGKSSLRSSSSVSASELSQYNTHLILALPSGEVLTSSYKNFYSSFALGLMNTADNKVSLEIPLNTQMKIFAFLFKENYSMSELFSGTRTVGYYGESQSFSIGSQTNNLSLGITLIQVPGTGTDTTAPTASVTAATITTSGNAVVQSTETGTAYLVKTTVSVSNNFTSITGAADSQWNSVAISLANTDTNLPATGLADGTYKVYAVDAAGNLSSASSNSVTVATTVTDTTAPTASVTAATITTSGNAVVKSTETGTAYLVNTAITVSNLDSITGAADNQWNSVTISSADTDTNLPATGLADGTYKVYAIDAAGNLSSASSNSVNVATDYALDFDGTNDYVVADGVTSNLNSSTGLPFTVSAWAYPDTTTREAIFAFNNSGANLNLLYYAQDGSTQKFYHHGTGGNSYTGSSNTFESGQWHLNVIVVDSSGNGKLFVNGGQEATWSSGTNTSVNKFSIGQEYDGTGSSASDFFDGKIDEVAIWNVALSAADVTALYNSGNGLKASANSGNYDNSADLVGYWKFNEGTGTTLTDNTSNSNNGTLTNMDSSDWVNGMDNGSMYYYKVAAVNSSGTGPLSSVASAILDQRIQVSETFNGHTYALTSAAMTWAQGKAIATALGGYLTTINTKAENDWLTAIFRIPYGESWIGANDIATNNTWVWDNGTTSGDDNLTDTICNAPSGDCRPSNATWADGSRKWNGGEPNNAGGEDCANITRSDGTWNDLDCDRDQYGIIEFD